MAGGIGGAGPGSPSVRRTRRSSSEYTAAAYTVVSAWAGDLFTKRAYVRPDPESLRAGSDNLAELLG